MAIAEECAKIRRIGGGTDAARARASRRFTTNLDYLHAEGVELGFAFGFDLGPLGNLAFSGNVNKYLTQESRARHDAVVDCVGYFSTDCGNGRAGRRCPKSVGSSARPGTRRLHRPVLWRHWARSSAKCPGVFPAFQKIDSYDYFDLYAATG